MVDDDARDALRAASQHLIEVTRILDDAIVTATRLGDDGLLERLARAKAAAERGEALIDRIGVTLGDDLGQDHSSTA